MSFFKRVKSSGTVRLFVPAVAPFLRVQLPLRPSLLFIVASATLLSALPHLALYSVSHLLFTTWLVR